MTSLIFIVCAILVLIALEGFFSGSEISFLSANRPKIFRRAKEKDKRAQIAQDLLKRPEALFSTTIIGTTLCINAATTLMTVYLIQRYGYAQEWINLVLLTPLILIFGEFIPKMAGRSNPEEKVLQAAMPLYLVSYLFYPVTRALTWYAELLKRLIGGGSEKGFFLSREEIKAAIPASRGSDVTPAERSLIERILDFGRTTVKEMLRPLIDVVAVDETATLAEAVKLFTESGHSRLPVYQDRIDRIVGVIQGFDCLRAANLNAPVKSAMQAPFFVPESKPIDELLMELKSRPMAIVVNEYGGAEGIITMEDVMEEVVGEIEDEYDEPPRLFHQIGDNSYIVNARVEIFDLREQLNLPIPEDDDYQTLAGFLLKRMQKIPKKWDSAIIDGVEYVVQSATDRSIEEVYIVVHKKPDSDLPVEV